MAIFPEVDDFEYGKKMDLDTKLIQVEALSNYEPEDPLALREWAQNVLRGAKYANLTRKDHLAEDLAEKAVGAFEKLQQNPITGEATAFSQAGEDGQPRIDLVLFWEAKSIMATNFSHQGKWNESVKLHKEVIEARKTLFGPCDKETLQCKRNLASAHMHLGDIDEAIKVAKETLDVAVEDDSKLRAMGTLGRCYMIKALFDEAEEILTRSISLWKQRNQEKEAAFLDNMLSLATVYQWQSCYEKAESMYKETLRIQTESRGPHHPRTLDYQSALGTFYQSMRRFDDAEPLIQDALDRKSEALGVNHHEVVDLRADLGVLYMEQRKLKESEKYLLEAIDTNRAQNRHKTQVTLRSMASLSNVYSLQKRFEEALVLKSEVLKLESEVHGEDHPDTIQTRIEMGNLFVDLERWEEAEKQLRVGLEQNTRAFNEKHYLNYVATVGVTNALRGQNKLAEAEELGLELRRQCEADLGACDIDTLNSIFALARTWKAQGRHPEALELMKDCRERKLEAVKRRAGDTHSSPLMSRIETLIKEWTEGQKSLSEEAGPS